MAPHAHPASEIVLYCAGPGFGLPEVSPYATKTEVQLQLAGLPYRKAPARPDQGPKGQIPFIEDNGRALGDSTFIRAYIEQAYGVDLDEGLSALERAQAWAIERMLENHLGWCGAWTRFMVDANFERGPRRWFDHAPADQREEMVETFRLTVAQNLRVVGVGRHSETEILALGTKSLSALSTLLGAKPFLFGERPCGVDATAFAILAGILTPHFDSGLRRRAQAYDGLVAYVDRMMALFYPDFAWKLEEAVAA